jgi:hypothetical protein
VGRVKTNAIDGLLAEPDSHGLKGRSLVGDYWRAADFGGGLRREAPVCYQSDGMETNEKRARFPGEPTEIEPVRGLGEKDGLDASLLEATAKRAQTFGVDPIHKTNGGDHSLLQFALS